MANFDSLVDVYRGLEFTAFGRDLERARFGFIDRLADRESILILGEGDGRFLSRLLTRAPRARVHCVDSSPGMLARARQRIERQEGAERVTFECADALAHDFPPARYDAVVTLFFLDCFSGPDAGRLVPRIAASLRPQARWLFADFVLPPPGLARMRARLWLTVLYAFFRWQTGITTRRLPPSEDLIAAAGFRREASQAFQWGLVRTSFFTRG